MKVVVIGAGYVGLVQAAVLAEIGHFVIGVDINAERVSELKKGNVPIYEPFLSDLIVDCIHSKTLDFTVDYAEALKGADIVFIAVGTPPGEDGSADLRYVKAVARDVSMHISSPALLVTKSTVPVGTGDQLEMIVDDIIKSRFGAEENGRDWLTVVSNPEFLKEGSALADCRRPDRIIIGTDSAEAVTILKSLYAPLNRNHDKIIVMGRRDAEFSKYAANCMLATKISFINEMAQLAMRLNVDIESVRKGIGSDPRIGSHFIYPGCGYGGSCFPKDVKALIKIGQNVGLVPTLLQAVEEVNAKQKQMLPAILKRLLGEDLSGRTIALWGLSFKPNTDDMREAPSLVLIDSIIASGGRVNVFDPEAMGETRDIYNGRIGISFMPDRDSCLSEADALVVCTEWKIFQAPDLKLIKDKVKSGIVIDGRNLYDPVLMKKHGLRYYAVGRGESVFLTE